MALGPRCHGITLPLQLTEDFADPLKFGVVRDGRFDFLGWHAQLLAQGADVGFKPISIGPELLDRLLKFFQAGFRHSHRTGQVIIQHAPRPRFHSVKIVMDTRV